MKKHICLATRPRRVRAFLAAVGILAFLLNSCAISRAPLDTPDQPQAPRGVRIVPPQEGLPGRVDSLEKVASSGQKVASPAPKGGKPGLLSGIGHLFSTPEGTAHRRAVRLAASAVPRKLAKGAVYAPAATEVVNAYKPRAAVVNADSGAIVTAIDKNKGAAATAPGATATNAPDKPFPWWIVVALAAAGYVGYRKFIS